MKRIYSNGASRDYVIKPFERLIARASRLHLAAPYFTAADTVIAAVAAGKSVQLLVGLNSATSPSALAQVLRAPNISIRYLTHRFHAKIYLFDDAAILGSANLTDGGLRSNREAIICLDQPEDREAIEEVRALFLDLWNDAKVLTPSDLQTFKSAWEATRQKGRSPDELIEEAVGRAEPRNVSLASQTKSRERLFLDDLQRQVYEQYRPAFSEVSDLLAGRGFRRPDLAVIGLANETNRFLNWVRRTYVIGDEAWRSAPLRPPQERQKLIAELGAEWAVTSNSKVPETYIDWLATIGRIFGTREGIDAASKEDLTEGLMSLHAFTEQLRFVKGGLAALPTAFWAANDEDVEKVRRTLAYLLHGPGDFVPRLHDVLYDPRMKLGLFGFFCALELYGTVRPDDCPPMNGRMAKALRFLGFDVRAA
ncbi:phospholipase D family protein [Phenylobacterium soli]|uniref:Phospholipase D n=1 Tax=Phenylobacterium soli TaxID=2170551 RepID=A0A328AMZ0_9CAUL|nr:phospholipase D family protein [Phenylobacterium soli]RAK55907.1 hypothetical protein DJ017_16025 [Phenylobacterium soli]